MQFEQQRQLQQQQRQQREQLRSSPINNSTQYGHTPRVFYKGDFILSTTENLTAYAISYD